MERKVILTGRWTVEELDGIIGESCKMRDAGERIEFLSGLFIGVAYKESTLIGDINTREVFVINLEGVDCLTFIEYIEAMRLSDSFIRFIEVLKEVRYRNGIVSFETRNHFFTDWAEYNSEFIEDITSFIGRARTMSVRKRLNVDKEGRSILPGIPHREREIKYIPVNVPINVIDESVLDGLKTGDYVGVYSDKEGLDVSHVGIIIKSAERIYLRHASSRDDYRKVVDEDFMTYMAKKPGLVVLRAK